MNLLSKLPQPHHRRQCSINAHQKTLRADATGLFFGSCTENDSSRRSTFPGEPTITGAVRHPDPRRRGGMEPPEVFRLLLADATPVMIELCVTKSGFASGGRDNSRWLSDAAANDQSSPALGGVTE